jgi:dolichol-phosphate mannosyltransferase
MTDSSARAQSVSIIVPTLNEEENIAPLVSQITACAVPFREILFVDDHSTDATRAEIRALEGSHQIRLIEQDDADLGLAGAIMSGARAAEGEILLVIGRRPKSSA